MTAEPLLAIIAGREPDGYLELRWPVKGGMGQDFHRVTEQRYCARVIATLKDRTDVFVGAAPRTKREGGKAAVARTWALWVDCDTPEAVQALVDFPHPPTLTIRSGSGTNLHAWWALTNPVPTAYAEQGNRRLAGHLGADMRATDAARILRPPGTLNFKHAPPAKVEIAEQAAVGYGLADLVSNIPDPKPPRVTQPPRRVARGDSLSDVAVEDYYAALTGLDPLRGNSQCPFHAEDRNPSMRLYPATNTFYCFSCQYGGTIYEFGAKLWGLGTRGEDFLELQRRLREALGAGE